MTFNATGTAGAATQLAITTQPSGASSGAVFTTQPVVVIRDANNNQTTITAAVTAAIVSGTGTLTGTATVNAVNGVATFTDLLITGSGAHEIRFTSGTLANATSASFAVASDASTIAANSVTTQSAVAGSNAGAAPSVLVTNAAAAPVAGVTVTFAVTVGGGSVTPSTVVTNASGIATVTSWTLGTTAGPNTVTATATGLTGSPVTFNATGTAGPATQLVLTTEPAGAVTGNTFNQQPTISVRDANGNQTTSTAAVTAAVFSGSGVLTGPTTVNAVNGVATFANLLITGAGNHTIRFTSGSLTNATSSVFNVAAGPPTQLSISTQPDGAANTAPFTSQPVIVIRDAGGFQTTSTAAVTVAVFSGSGVLTGTLTVNAVNGIATFAGLTLTGTGAHTLRFTSPGLSDATSASFTITAGPATTIAAQSPLTQTSAAGAPVGAPPSVLVTDVSGNPVSGITVTFAVTGGGGSIAPTTVVTNAVGTATLTSWTLGAAAGENTVTATAAGLTGSPITFTATGTAEFNVLQTALRMPISGQSRRAAIAAASRDQRAGVR
ncbi:MAG: hypothetical protein IT353_13905 [Gemmatimonadaceae bacterium]|nr:hypothetical protein [Gemmatimonadaceae bacterium]